MNFQGIGMHGESTGLTRQQMHLGLEGLQQVILVGRTAAQGGELALCCISGGLLCQEGSICNQVRAFTTLHQIDKPSELPDVGVSKDSNHAGTQSHRHVLALWTKSNVSRQYMVSNRACYALNCAGVRDMQQKQALEMFCPCFHVDNYSAATGCSET